MITTNKRMIRRRKLGEEPKKVLSLNTNTTTNNDSSLHPSHTTTKTSSLSLAPPPPPPLTSTSSSFKHNNDSILSIKWIIWISIGIILRILLFHARFDLTLQKQVEFSTPTTSFRRVTEGLHLVTQLNQSPYNSTMFLQPPLILLPFLSFYQWSESSREIDRVSQYDWFCRCLFIGMDVVITVLLFQIAKIHRTNVDLAHSFDSNEALLQSSSSLHGFHSNLPHIIAALYLFNPIMICSCVSMSTVIFNNLALAATVYFALKGNVVWCTMSVSLASYQNLFPLVLIVPITLMIQRAYAYEYYLKRRSSSDLKVKKNHSLLYSSSNHVVVVGIKVVLLFSFWFALWMYLSYVMTGHSWQFIENAYVYPMSVQDLTPNWSNFWYMFTEVFDHFRRFFLLIFHVHQFAYILPLTVRLKYVYTQSLLFVACEICLLFTIYISLYLLLLYCIGMILLSSVY